MRLSLLGDSEMSGIPAMHCCSAVAQSERQAGSGTGAAEELAVNATRTAPTKETMENFIVGLID